MLNLRSDKNLQRFTSFLIENGAVIKDPTNTWEILRYKIEGSGTVVIHRNSRGFINIPNDARQHLECYEAGRAIDRRERPGKDHKKKLIERLLERDGSDCCICSKPLGEDITIEHWVSIKDGGTNCMANLGLAHAECNRVVDSKPVSEKLRLAMEMRHD